MLYFPMHRSVSRRHTSNGGNDRLEFAVSAMQGYRPTMEDSHAAFGDLGVPPDTSFFAVYDGHGGPAVARFCANHLHAEVLNHPEYGTNLTSAVERAFFRMDELLRENAAREELAGYSGHHYFEIVQRASFLNCFRMKRDYIGPMGEGSTACVAVIRDNQIIVGNTGDSRCVLSRNGQAIDLSTDHKPNNPNEAQRIQAAGSSVSRVRGAYRLDGIISVSRAIGDMRFKQGKDLTPEQQALTCAPEIVSEHITDDTEFLVLACDGIWDVMESQQVVDFVRGLIRSGVNLGRTCENLLQNCITGRRQTMDNMTVILVRFGGAPSSPLTPTVPRSPRPRPQVLVEPSPDDWRSSKGHISEAGTSVPNRKSI